MKARELYGKLKTIYQERLDYHAGTPVDQQYNNIDNIIADMEAYRRNIDMVIANDEREMAEKETLIFNEYIDKFQHFYKDEDDIDMLQETFDNDPDLQDSVTIKDTITPDNTRTDALEDTTSIEVPQ